MMADGVLLPGCGRTTVGAYAVATNVCGNNATSSPKIPIVIGDNSICSPVAAGGRADSARGAKTAGMSDLSVPGGQGQVVLNGSDALVPVRGRVPLAARLLSGENRVEATLVQATGQAGTWRFELGSTAGLVSGSLRVLAGNVAEISGDTVVFRFAGRAGERVVFTFPSRGVRRYST
jgi:hypothetical protein